MNNFQRVYGLSVSTVQLDGFKGKVYTPHRFISNNRIYTKVTLGRNTEAIYNTLFLFGDPVPPLASKPVECAALPLEGVHHVHGGHSLPLGVLSVGHSVADDVLQEYLENAPGQGRVPVALL